MRREKWEFKIQGLGPIPFGTRTLDVELFGNKSLRALWKSVGGGMAFPNPTPIKLSESTPPQDKNTVVFLSEYKVQSTKYK